MEYLEDNLEEWLSEELEVRAEGGGGTRAWCGPPASQPVHVGACMPSCMHAHRHPPVQGYGEDDYLLFDCPGQIELYSHVSVFRTFVDFLKRDGWNVCAVGFLVMSAGGQPHACRACMQSLTACLVRRCSTAGAAALAEAQALDGRLPAGGQSLAGLGTACPTPLCPAACAQVYCMDAQFVAEPPKFVAGCLSALSAMVQLELPHVNMLTKVDLVQDKVCDGFCWTPRLSTHAVHLFFLFLGVQRGDDVAVSLLPSAGLRPAAAGEEGHGG